MATARKYLVDPEQPLYYHITSRCVQKAWLLGKDPITGRNYNHRKDWLLKQLDTITPAFSVSVQTYAVMSNHFHLVVYYDPLAARQWTPTEVATRWYLAHPAQLANPDDPQIRAEAIELLVENQERLEQCRAKLGSLSEYMKRLKQPIAERANTESDTDGHYWAKRFYSGAILSEEALLAVMAYVDLNPVRAKIARFLEECHHTGLEQRIRASEVTAASLETYLAPCMDGLGTQGVKVNITLATYLRFLRELLGIELTRSMPPKAEIAAQVMTREERWASGKQTLRRRPRAIGNSEDLSNWLTKRGLSNREQALPRFTR